MAPDEFAKLVPELICRDVEESRRFYTELLGFSVAYSRDGFHYLDHGGAQIMLEQQGDNWVTATLDRPYGRGVNFQIEVDALQPILDRLSAEGIALFEGPQAAWYRDGDIEHGQRQILVQDPDGYLLRFFEPLGTRGA